MDRRTLLAVSASVASSLAAGCLEDGDTQGGSTEEDDRGDAGDTDMTDSATDSDHENGDQSPDGTETDDRSEDGTETDDRSEDGTETDDRSEDGTETDENPSNERETCFEILGSSHNAGESAAVAVEDRTIVITGHIMGNNGCYTARLDGVVIKDDTLIVSIQSYEDAAEDELCTQSIIFIEYEVSITIRDEVPPSVRVEHNGDQVTTEQSS